MLVRLVEDDSPASRAGLATGDLIVRAAGEPVRSIDDLFKALETAADNVIELVILRGAEERAVEVQLGGEPAAASPPDTEVSDLLCKQWLPI